MGLELDYFYNNETEKFQFYRIPKILIKSRFYKGVSITAKMLYSLMLDRSSMSVKKGLMDEDGRVYIIYPSEEIKEDICCGHSALAGYIKELISSGLIEKKTQGLGKPDIIYVKNFASDVVMNDLLGEKNAENTEESQNSEKRKSRVPENGNQEFRKTEIQSSGKRKSGIPENGGQEFRKAETQGSGMQKAGIPENGGPEFRKTEALNTISIIDSLRETDLNETSSSLYSTKEENEEETGSGRWEGFIKTQIDYPELIKEYPDESGLICKFVSVVVNVFASESMSIRVNSKQKPRENVVSQLMKLKPDHIRYVVNTLRELNKTQGSLSETYILTCLYNSINVYNVENAATSPEKTNSDSAVSHRTKFTNFQERDYDFAELEKRFARN